MNAHTRSSTLKIVEELKAAGNDFEFYPTKISQLDVIKKDIKKQCLISSDDPITESVLDIGCGTGSALEYLTEGKRYAIEKAPELIASLDKSIFIVGTDYQAQSLLDKKVAILFMNPIFSDFENWTLKLIQEGNAEFAYLILPIRWEKSEAIKDALKERSASIEILATDTYLDAFRQARATVHVLRVNFASKRQSYFRGNQVKVDPFKLWFDTHFKINAKKTKQSSYQFETSKKESLKEKSKNSDLIKSEGLVKVLERLYDRDIEVLMNNYLKVSELDSDLLEELNVNIENLQNSLEQKIMSLKDLYWRELFNNLTTITEKLTKKSRKKLLDTLFENTYLDFSAENAHGVVHWVIKNANSYFDDQLIDCHNSLTERANIVLYKSNKKTFKDENWNYCRRPNDLDRYALDHRIVLHNAGGLATSSWSHENPDCGLSDRAITLLDDLCTIAINLNFDRTGQKTTTDFLWDTHIKNTFMFHDHVSNKEVPLFEAKAFKNGNLHIKLNQDFICRLNIEFGRLKGWLSSAREAAQEMDVTEREAELSFNSNVFIEASQIKMLLIAA